MGRRGFTLIELLIVIAVIGILAAILFPVFARARENARRASCMSNMKQIGMGTMQYVQDYDERFPGYGGSTSACWYYNLNPAGSPAIYKTTSWAQDIQPYVKSTQIFVCPSDKRKPPAGQELCSYGYNSPDLASSTGAPLVKVTVPSQFMMWFEDSDSDTAYDTIACQSGDDRFRSDVMALTRHLEGLNLLFVDGHVKWYKLSHATTVPDVYTQKGIYTNFTVVP
jgi:prepilin-type N-terminal cleavage/methylation domain-containing protein/prepilin-type processing-associated H-X9-DG protein